MRYPCINSNAGNRKVEKWNGEVEYLKRKADGFEGIISGKSSSMFFVVGESERGTYICLPEWGIGSDLADLNDVFWNRERLQKQKLSVVDAITLATGLQVIATCL